MKLWLLQVLCAQQQNTFEAEKAMWEYQPPRTSSPMLMSNGFVVYNLQGTSRSVCPPAPRIPESARFQSSASAHPSQFSQVPPAHTAVDDHHTQNFLPKDVQQGENSFHSPPQQQRQQQQRNTIEQQRHKEQQQRYQRQFERQQLGSSRIIFDSLYMWTDLRIEQEHEGCRSIREKWDKNWR